MKPFEVYQTFLTLKAHFRNNGFDFHRYGKVKVLPETFERRKDRYFFEKLSKKYSGDELVEFLLSQFLVNKKWIGDMLSEEATEAHTTRTRRVQSLQYHIKTEINQLWALCKETPDKFNNMFTPVDGSYAPIFKYLMEKKISPETFVVLDDILHFTKSWNTAGDPIWEEIGIPILRYAPFLHLESRRDELKKIIAEILTKDLHFTK